MYLAVEHNLPAPKLYSLVVVVLLDNFYAALKKETLSSSDIVYENSNLST